MYPIHHQAITHNNAIVIVPFILMVCNSKLHIFLQKMYLRHLLSALVAERLQSQAMTLVSANECQTPIVR